MRHLFALAMLFILACGGTSEGTRPMVATAPSEVGSVVFLLVGSSDQQVAPEARETAQTIRDIVRRALGRSGYTVVDRAGSPHEAELALGLSIQKRPQIVSWMKDGKVMGGYAVNAQLDIACEGRAIDHAEIEFRVTLGEPDPEDVVPLVQQLNASERLARFGTYMVSHRQAIAEQTRVKMEADQEARLQEWRQKYATPCAEAKTLNACERLSAWLSHERGEADAQMVDEGKRIVSGSESKIESLRDDVDWLEAKEATCLEFATDESCSGVAHYMAKHPEGAHRVSGAAALENVRQMATKRSKEREDEARRGQLREQEQNRQDAARGQAEAEKQKREDAKRACRSACGNKCASVLEQSAFQACSRSCLSGCN
jgi:hypothetical protein